MQRPPLITFLTYERLGNTAVALPSLLRTEDDFELYLMDNDSTDDTWEFLMDTRDPRIKVRKRFEHNMGVGHALNWALSHRTHDQDFINFEYDFRIHNKHFIQDFRNVLNEFPGLRAVSATTFPSQLQLIDERRSKDPSRFEERNGIRVYFDSIMGFCAFFPADTMNILMYYDEVNCLLDMDLQARIEVLGNSIDKNLFATAYAMDIRTSQIIDGGVCGTCLAYHSYCEQGEQKCLKNYKRIMTKINNTLGFRELHRITSERLEGRLGFKCNSIFSGDPMSPEEEAGSRYVLELFKKFTKEARNDQT